MGDVHDEPGRRTCGGSFLGAVHRGDLNRGQGVLGEMVLMEHLVSSGEQGGNHRPDRDLEIPGRTTVERPTLPVAVLL